MDSVTDVHRVVKEILDAMVFACPKCQTTKRNYHEIFKHISTCEGKDAQMLGEPPIGTVGGPVGPGSLVVCFIYI